MKLYSESENVWPLPVLFYWWIQMKSAIWTLLITFYGTWQVCKWEDLPQYSNQCFFSLLQWYHKLSVGQLKPTLPCL